MLLVEIEDMPGITKVICLAVQGSRWFRLDAEIEESLTLITTWLQVK